LVRVLIGFFYYSISAKRGKKKKGEGEGGSRRWTG